MARIKRRQLYVDRKVQGGLILRTVIYWFFCLISIVLLLTCWTVLTGPRQTAGDLFAGLWFRYGPALVASIILLPIVVVDCARFSNRFAGPIFRLRRCLRRLADGEHVGPIHFRENDFWQDMPVAFNHIARRLDEAAASADEPAASADEPPEETPDTADRSEEPVAC